MPGPNVQVGADTDLREYARQAAIRAGIDPDIYVRQIDQESGFNPNAYNASGATGIAQIVPKFHPNVNANDPIASLDYAAGLMKSHLDRYGGDYQKALAAYNAGPGNVDAAGGVPDFPETQQYVRNILNLGPSGRGHAIPPPVFERPAQNLLRPAASVPEPETTLPVDSGPTPLSPAVRDYLDESARGQAAAATNRAALSSPSPVPLPSSMREAEEAQAGYDRAGLQSTTTALKDVAQRSADLYKRVATPQQPQRLPEEYEQILATTSWDEVRRKAAEAAKQDLTAQRAVRAAIHDGNSPALIQQLVKYQQETAGRAQAWSLLADTAQTRNTAIPSSLQEAEQYQARIGQEDAKIAPDLVQGQAPYLGAGVGAVGGALVGGPAGILPGAFLGLTAAGQTQQELQNRGIIPANEMAGGNDRQDEGALGGLASRGFAGGIFDPGSTLDTAQNALMMTPVGVEVAIGRNLPRLVKWPLRLGIEGLSNYNVTEVGPAIRGFRGLGPLLTPEEVIAVTRHNFEGARTIPEVEGAVLQARRAEAGAPSLPVSPQEQGVAQAVEDWRQNRLYIDARGEYHRRPVDRTGAVIMQPGPLAPYNDVLKAERVTPDMLDDLAKQGMGQQEPQTLYQRSGPQDTTAFDFEGNPGQRAQALFDVAQLVMTQAEQEKTPRLWELLGYVRTAAKTVAEGVQLLRDAQASEPTPEGKQAAVMAERLWVQAAGLSPQRRIPGEPTISYRGVSGGAGGISELGTEGHGLYVTSHPDLAHEFGEAGAGTRKVIHLEPRNPLVVEGEPLHILQETAAVMAPPAATDSPWLRLHKQAVQDAGATDANWGQRYPAILEALTRRIREAGYDAVQVRNGQGNEWDVLLDPSLYGNDSRFFNTLYQGTPTGALRQRLRDLESQTSVAETIQRERGVSTYDPGATDAAVWAGSGRTPAPPELERLYRQREATAQALQDRALADLSARLPARGAFPDDQVLGVVRQLAKEEPAVAGLLDGTYKAADVDTLNIAAQHLAQRLVGDTKLNDDQALKVANQIDGVVRALTGEDMSGDFIHSRLDFEQQVREAFPGYSSSQVTHYVGLADRFARFWARINGQQNPEAWYRRNNLRILQDRASGAAALMQLDQDPGPVFFHASERALNQIRGGRATVQQVRSALSPKNGVKPDELKWTGMGGWLGEQEAALGKDGMLSVQAVRDALAERRVEVGEVLKGGAAPDLTWSESSPDNWLASLPGIQYQVYRDNRGWRARAIPDDGSGASSLGLYATLEQAQRTIMAEVVSAGVAGTRWGVDSGFGVTTPGGENYRELLLTWSPEQAARRQLQRVYEEWDRLQGEMLRKYSPQFEDGQGLSLIQRMAPDERAHWDQLVAESGKLETQLDPTAWIPSGQELRSFHSIHWDEPNVLVHMRFDERTLPDGRRVLFVQEIQSDWNQVGRKEGFQGENPWDQQMIATRQETPTGPYWEVKDANGRFITNVTDQSIITAEDAIAEAQSRLAQPESSRVARHYDTPQNPFMKTDQWAGLALRRMVRWATEQGFDAVAWTPGEVQVERSPSNEGLVNFYDTILPRLAGDFGKQWGVQPGRVDMPLREQRYDVYLNGNTLGTELTQDQVDDLRVKYGSGVTVRNAYDQIAQIEGIHILPINQEMRQSVLQNGVNLWQRDLANAGPSNDTPYVSTLGKALDALAVNFPKGMTVDQAVARLSSSKVPGLKAAEMAFTGMDEWLAAAKAERGGNGRVTAEEMRAVFQQKQVQLQDVMLGEPLKLEWRDVTASKQNDYEFAQSELEDLQRQEQELRNRLRRARSEAERDDIGNELNDVLPEPGGGQQYELYDQHGRHLYDAESTMHGSVQVYPAETGGNVQYFDSLQEAQQVMSLQKVETRYQQYMLPGTTNYRELLIKFNPEGKSYQAPHFGKEEGQNLLAHTLMSDRFTLDGTHLLNAEEAQSDWLQQAAKQGFYSAEKDARFRAITERMSDISAVAVSRELTPAEKAEMRRLQGERQAIGKQTGRMPQAPFLDTWQELLVRRLLYQASLEGYDAMSWSDGRSQVQKYGTNLAAWLPSGDGGFQVHLQTGVTAELAYGDRSPRYWVNRLMPNASRPGVVTVRSADDLRLHIDQDFVQSGDAAEQSRMAERLWAKMQASPEGVWMPRKEGMEQAYDREMTGYGQKLAKKFGVAVQDRQVVTKPGEVTYNVALNDGARSQYPTEEAAQAAVDAAKQDLERYGDQSLYWPEWQGATVVTEQKPPETMLVHSIPVTPEMRAAVLRDGVTLFQRPAEYTGKRLAQFRINIEKPSGLMAELRRADLWSADEVAQWLGSERPDYLDATIQYMNDIRQRLLTGEITSREVAKAWVMSVMSQQATERDPVRGTNKTPEGLTNFMTRTQGLQPGSRVPAGVREEWDAGKIPETFNSYVWKDGSPKVRPEEAAAMWLLSSEGERALDNLEAGNYSRQDWLGLERVRAAYGSPQFVSLNVFGDRGPGGTRLEQVAEATRLINEGGKLAAATGSTAALQEAVGRLNGIGPAKNPFIRALLGFGDEATMDAVEINLWIAGKSAVEQGRPVSNPRGLTTPDMELAERVKDYLVKNAPMAREFKKKLDERLAALKGILNTSDPASPNYLDPAIASHVLHHWLWDTAKRMETSHDGMYLAMKLAQEDAATQGARGAVTFSDDGKAVIRAFQAAGEVGQEEGGANITTLAHELAHVWRRDLPDDMLQRAAADFGAADPYNWSVDAEEKFARGFERYLREGGQGHELFDNFKAWFTEVYRYVRNSPIDVNLSPDMKSMFDQMLGVREQDPHAAPAGQAGETLNQAASGAGGQDRGFADTLRGAEATSPYLRGLIDQDGRFKYEKITNQDTWVQANNVLDSNPVEASATLAMLGRNPEAVDAKGIAVGFARMIRAQEEAAEHMAAGRKDQATALYDEAANLAAGTATALTKAGQVVQAASMWQRLSPQGVLRFAAQYVQKSKTGQPLISLAVSGEQADALVAAIQREGGSGFTPEHALRLINDVQRGGGSSLTGQQAKDIALRVTRQVSEFFGGKADPALSVSFERGGKTFSAQFQSEAEKLQYELYLLTQETGRPTKPPLLQVDVAAPPPAGDDRMAEILARLQALGIDEATARKEGKAIFDSVQRRAATAGESPVPRGSKAANVTTATGADPNRPYEFRFRVMPLDEVVASHVNPRNPSPNPEYTAPGLQPRNRSAMASREQILNGARQLQPDDLLYDTRTLDRGPMIVGPDRLVESGNGRTLMLQLAREQFPERWQAYQTALNDEETLARAGLSRRDLQGIQDPVLVRERTTPLDEQQRANFALEANAPTVLGASRVENAASDARLINDEALSKLQVGEDQGIGEALQSTNNKTLVDDFLAGLGNEAGRLRDAAGGLNRDGLDRLQAALFARVFGVNETGNRLIRTFFESPDPTIANVRKGLLAGLGDLAHLEGRVRSGVTDAGLSLADDLSKATDMLARLRLKGQTAARYVEQGQLFGRELTPLQEQLLVHLEATGRSPRLVHEFLTEYAARASDAPPPGQAGMFGEALAGGPTKEGILDAVIRDQGVRGDTLTLQERQEAALAKRQQAADVRAQADMAREAARTAREAERQARAEAARLARQRDQAQAALRRNQDRAYQVTAQAALRDADAAARQADREAAGAERARVRAEADWNAKAERWRQYQDAEADRYVAEANANTARVQKSVAGLAAQQEKAFQTAQAALDQQRESSILDAGERLRAQQERTVRRAAESVARQRARAVDPNLVAAREAAAAEADGAKAIKAAMATARKNAQADLEARGAFRVDALTPENAKKMVDKAIADTSGSMGDVLTPEVQQNLQDRATKLQGLEPGSREAFVQTAVLMRDIHELVPASKSEKWSGFLAMAQLGSVPTILRNVLGNAAFAASENFTQVWAALWDNLRVSVMGGGREVGMPSFRREMTGFWTGLKQGTEETVKGISITALPGQVERGGGGRTFRTSARDVLAPDISLLSRVGRALDTIPHYAEILMNLGLQVPDKAFYQAAVDGAVPEFAFIEAQRKGYKGQQLSSETAKGIVNPSAWVAEQAHARGLYRTFQNDTALAGMAVRFKAFMNLAGTGEMVQQSFQIPFAGKTYRGSVPTHRFGLGNFVLNYPRVPSNIMMAALDYSPAAFAMMLPDTVMALSDWAHGHTKDRDLALRLQRGLWGSGLLTGGGFFLGSVGLLTGGPSSDPGERQSERDSGIRPYSLNATGLWRAIKAGPNFSPEVVKKQAGDVFITYDWLAPLSMSAALGVDAAKPRMKKNGAVGRTNLADLTDAGDLFSQMPGLFNTGGDVILNGMTFYSDQGILRSIKQFTSSRGSESALVQVVKDAPASMVPAILYQLTKLLDNSVYETREQRRGTFTEGVIGGFDEAVNTILAKLPGGLAFFGGRTGAPVGFSAERWGAPPSPGSTARGQAGLVNGAAAGLAAGGAAVPPWGALPGAAAGAAVGLGLGVGAGPMPLSYGTWGGQPQQRFQEGTNNFWNVFVNPAYVSQYRPIDGAWLDAMKAAGDPNGGQYPRPIPRDIQARDENGDLRTWPLTSQERSLFEQQVSQDNAQVFGDLHNSPEFQRATPAAQRDLIRQATLKIQKKAEVWLQATSPEREAGSGISPLQESVRQASDWNKDWDGRVRAGQKTRIQWREEHTKVAAGLRDAFLKEANRRFPDAATAVDTAFNKAVLAQLAQTTDREARKNLLIEAVQSVPTPQVDSGFVNPDTGEKIFEPDDKAYFQARDSFLSSLPPADRDLYREGLLQGMTQTQREWLAAQEYLQPYWQGAKDEALKRLPGYASMLDEWEQIKGLSQSDPRRMQFDARWKFDPRGPQKSAWADYANMVSEIRKGLRFQADQNGQRSLNRILEEWYNVTPIAKLK